MIRQRNLQVTAVAHDYFTQRGGAERVAAALVDHFRPPVVLTAAHESANTFAMWAPGEMKTSFIQRIPSLRKDPRRALPLLPLAWALMPPVTSGVLICSSSGWAHSARASGTAVKVVYCHNPARWLYQPDDFWRGGSAILRVAVAAISPFLRRWDRAAAASAHLYIANSQAVAQRIKDTYSRECLVIPPPVTLNADGPRTQVTGLPEDFFVTVSRARAYKNTERLFEAFALAPNANLVVVGNRPDRANIPDNVYFTGRVHDDELRWIYRRARALVSISSEDFGLTPLEANAQGTPALVIRAGGFLDSLDDGISGQYLDEDEPAYIADRLGAFPRNWDEDALRHHAASFSLASFTAKLTAAIEVATARASE